jgi:hypothetical protein
MSESIEDKAKEMAGDVENGEETTEKTPENDVEPVIEEAVEFERLVVCTRDDSDGTVWPKWRHHDIFR